MGAEIAAAVQGSMLPCTAMVITTLCRHTQSSRHSLLGRGARLMGTARRVSRASGQTEHLYGETRYAAGTWDRAAASSSKPRSCVIPGASPKTTRASRSPTSCTRPDIGTRRSTAPAGTSRIGSKVRRETGEE